MTEVAAAGAHAEEGVTLMRVSSAPTAHAAVVTVAPGEVGAHVGLSYRVDDSGARRHLHLAWHHRLQNDEVLGDDVLWVVPGLDDVALADVGNAAHLIARQHAGGRVPYAFRKGASRFTDGGVLERLAAALTGEAPEAQAPITLAEGQQALAWLAEWVGKPDKRAASCS